MMFVFTTKKCWQHLLAPSCDHSADYLFSTRLITTHITIEVISIWKSHLVSFNFSDFSSDFSCCILMSSESITLAEMPPPPPKPKSESGYAAKPKSGGGSSYASKPKSESGYTPKPKSGSSLRVIWIPGRKKQHDKGVFKPTNLNVEHKHGERKNEVWSLGGSKSHDDILTGRRWVTWYLPYYLSFIFQWLD